jgi:hypothetical protein
MNESRFLLNCHACFFALKLTILSRICLRFKRYMFERKRARFGNGKLRCLRFDHACTPGFKQFSEFYTRKIQVILQDRMKDNNYDVKIVHAHTFHFLISIL